MSQKHSFDAHPRRHLLAINPTDAALDEAAHFQHIRRLGRYVALACPNIEERFEVMDAILQAGTIDDLDLIEVVIAEARTQLERGIIP